MLTHSDLFFFFLLLLKEGSFLSDLLMVLVTSPWLLITHPSRDLQHCGHHNNTLACVGDLPDKIPTISHYNGKTIKIKNA